MCFPSPHPVIPGLRFRLLSWSWKGISEINVLRDGDGAMGVCRGAEGQSSGVGDGAMGGCRGTEGQSSGVCEALTLHPVALVVTLSEPDIELDTKASTEMARRTVSNILKAELKRHG